MKRFAVVLLALIMMFAVCAIAEEEEVVEEAIEEIGEEIEEEIVEAVIMYVGNCGTVNVYVEPDFNSEVVTSVMRNLEVEITGEVVDNGLYSYYPVTVDDLDGYILVDYLVEERVMTKYTVHARDNKLVIVRTAPSLSAPIADKPFLWHGTLRTETICCLEYFVGGHWAYLTTKIDDVYVEVGYIYQEEIW